MGATWMPLPAEGTGLAVPCHSLQHPAGQCHLRHHCTLLSPAVQTYPSHQHDQGEREGRASHIVLARKICLEPESFLMISLMFL